MTSFALRQRCFSTKELTMRLTLIAIALLATVAGCGGGARTSPAVPSNAGATFEGSNAGGAIHAPRAADRAVPVAAAPSGMPTPPAGAQWTIYCQTVAGAGHVQRANSVCDQLKSQTQLKDWYTVHGEGQSTIYYGFYKSFNLTNDPDSKRAQTDRVRIDALADQLGNRPFKFAFFVGLDSPDPIAPPEWNLINARGSYTLQIGAYTGSVDRKQAAVSAVRDARAQGIEAYYYHGDTTSSVCVGAFPDSAIRRDELRSNIDGNPEQSFLKSTEPLPKAFADNLRDNQNKPVQVVQSKPIVVDPQLRETMRRFPEHAIKRELKILEMTDSVTGKKILKPADSFVVPIPQAVASPLTDPSMQGEPFQLTVPAEQPGVGRLRSIGQ